MIFAGAAPSYGSTLFDDHYVRSAELVKRDGTVAAPLGLSHSEVNTSLTGTSVTLNLASVAPVWWTRDVVVGVVLSGSTADTTYRVDFP